MIVCWSEKSGIGIPSYRVVRLPDKSRSDVGIIRKSLEKWHSWFAESQVKNWYMFLLYLLLSVLQLPYTVVVDFLNTRVHPAYICQILTVEATVA